MLATVLDKLISKTQIVFKLRHPVSPETIHSHTLANVVEDENGFWLELKCRHHDCQGNLKLRLSPEQVKEISKSF